MGKGTNTN